MKESSKGFWAAIIAYTLWGVFPVYWKFLKHVNSFEVVFHRIFWSFLFLNIVLFFGKRLKYTFLLLRNLKTLGYFLLSSMMIGINWFLYIWAVNTNKILDTSLGYYMAPIFNVLFARLLLNERMSKGRVIAFFFVLCGIGNMMLGLSYFPWVSIVLASTFSYYGFLRKKGALGSIEGLYVETFIMGIPSFLYLTYLMAIGKGAFGNLDIKTDMLLILSGPATAIPLLAFATAARRLRFITLGIIQYTAPTIAFLIGVFVYKESFSFKHLITFLFIWLAIGIYMIDSYFLIYNNHKS
ncbi:MAG: EamA family transporter RarD [Calditerrivibrio sp.]|nr:EamA family transporter RarD [Calditerrivibrio sp.]